ncbi:MAG: YraN family protein [Fimbriimonadaceae bacterium]|nr:YraN family protein [Fimbriimonadaceae bacterium]
MISLGWTLVRRRAKTRSGEIDLVALDGSVVVFVEVKRRRGGEAPEWSVTPAKQDRLKRAAEEYLFEAGMTEAQVRFDVIAIHGEAIRHLRDAFR